MTDTTPAKAKSDRINLIKRVQEDITKALIEKMPGKTMRALVEGKGRTEGSMAGRLDNNMVVEFASDKDLTASFVKVKITGTRGSTTLLGELV